MCMNAEGSHHAPEKGFAHFAAETLFGTAAHSIVNKQINVLAAFHQNDADIDLGQTEPSSYKMPPELLAHHAMLFFQCDGKIAAKIAHLKNEDGAPLVDRFGIAVEGGAPDIKFVNLWNAKTRDYDCYEEIAALRDEKTGFQGAAFFDHKHHRMTFSFGGTDFTNVKNDVYVSGGQMLGGHVDNRMTHAIPFTTAAMDRLQTLYPDEFKDADIDIAGHSVGGNAMPLAKYCIERHYGKRVRSQHIVEPAGTINAYLHASAMIAEAEKKSPSKTFDQLVKDAHTHKAKRGTFINWFPKLSKNIGDITFLDVKGDNPFSRHKGAAWVYGFMDEARFITEHRTGSAAHPGAAMPLNTVAKGAAGDAMRSQL